MENHRFDAIIQTLSCAATRRRVLGSCTATLTILLDWPRGVAQIGAAHDHPKNRKFNKKKKTKSHAPAAAVCTPRCRRKQCGDDDCGGTCGGCGAGQVCVSGTCCTPESPAETCAVRWGTVPDKFCHRSTACTCPGSRVQLDNGGCATICQSSCPGDCYCSPTTEGVSYCIAGVICSDPVCTSTADCAAGRVCRPDSCDPGVSRCVELCNG